MRKDIELRMSTGTSVYRRYVDIGFLGACRLLWRFWRHNGTHLDDYDEFRIIVLTSDHDRMKARLSRLKASEDFVSPELRRKALERLLDDDTERKSK